MDIHGGVFFFFCLFFSCIKQGMLGNVLELNQI